VADDGRYLERPARTGLDALSVPPTLGEDAPNQVGDGLVAGVASQDPSPLPVFLYPIQSPDP
jgi:hypothetical protein